MKIKQIIEIAINHHNWQFQNNCSFSSHLSSFLNLKKQVMRNINVNKIRVNLKLILCGPLGISNQIYALYTKENRCVVYFLWQALSDHCVKVNRRLCSQVHLAQD